MKSISLFGQMMNPARGKWQEVMRSRCGVPAPARLACDRYPVGSNITDQVRADVLLQELASISPGSE